MKIKKIFGPLIILLLILVAIVSITIPKFLSKEVPKTSLEKYEIANLKETSENVPDFNIAIVGAYTGELNANNIKEYNIKMYEFEAGIYDDGKVKTSKYVGFKLSEVLYESSIYEYSKLEFKSNNTRASTLREINENVYLVFMKDGKNINMSLLIVDKPYEKSLEDVIELYIENDYVQVDDSTETTEELN